MPFGSVTCLPAAGWKQLTACPRSVFSVCVCARVPVSQMGSSMWEGKKHDTCFCQSADCSVAAAASFAPSCSAISLSLPSCLILSRDKSRFPLLLPAIQAQTLQAAAADRLAAIRLPKPPQTPPTCISPPHPAPTAHLAARCLPGWPPPLTFRKEELEEFSRQQERVRCSRLDSGNPL